MKALLGDYPCTALFKKRAPLEFEDVKPPSKGFKRVVRGLEFDFAELAITTFLMAKAAGKPYRLLPAVVLARMQHGRLVRAAERGPLAPKDLEGKRVGVRSYSVTTGMWLRGILAEDYGVDSSRITWVTFEEAHVAEFRDPPNVVRAEPGKDLAAMLFAGEIDAAVTGDAPMDDPRIATVIPDAEAAAKAWRASHGAIHINHMVAVKDSVSRAQAGELLGLLGESFAAAGSPEMNPFGLEANRRNLEVAVEFVHRQGLIPRRYSVEELCS
ncbi:MAG TPA: phosphate ABC transporter substrate-binding protein [Burkholderiales bacterium]|nr:phosphate ABC transporter substrate-binding protein [Burkholderiales bacterium]